MKFRFLLVVLYSRVLAVVIISCVSLVWAADDEHARRTGDSLASPSAILAASSSTSVAQHKLSEVLPHSGEAVDSDLLQAVPSPSIIRQERIRQDGHSFVEIDGKGHMPPGAEVRGGGLRDHGVPAPEPFPPLLDPPSELSLAYLSEATYEFTTPVAGWELQAHVERASVWLPGTDRVALYKKDDDCAVVFAVTNEMSNWTSYPEATATQDLKQCNLTDVHKGMFEEFQQLLISHTWEEAFGPFFEVDGKCTGQVFAGGHGAGGALASLYAACANSANGAATLPPLYKNGIVVQQGQTVHFKSVSGLYTFGAPSVSKVQLVNMLAQDKTFAGGRFYNEDHIYFDPIPFDGSTLGLLHPKVAAIRLEGDDAGWVDRREYGATSVDARIEPNYFRTPLPHQHDIATYLERVHRAPLESDLTSPGLIGKSTTLPPSKVAVHAVAPPDTKGYQAILGRTNYSASAWSLPKNETVKAGAMRGLQSHSPIFVVLCLWTLRGLSQVQI